MLQRFGPFLVSLLLFPLAGVAALAQTTGQAARAHIVALSEDIGPRLAGSPGESRAADYIEGVFGELGYAPTKFVFLSPPDLLNVAKD